MPNCSAPETVRHGNVVQTSVPRTQRLPDRRRISFVLMAIITAAVLVYAKFLGTEDIA